MEGGFDEDHRPYRCPTDPVLTPARGDGAVTTNQAPAPTASVNLYWLPLGAGDNTHCVRTNGRIFEAVTARVERRDSCDLYHAALEVYLGSDRFTIEMAPVWSTDVPDRGVVCEGPVGLRWLGCSRLFRYEVRCWRDGEIPDAGEAVDSPQRLSADPVQAQQVLNLAPRFPTATWGRDELAAGEMWNSNSLIAWLLASSGHDVDSIGPPQGGRAPGWSAGLVVAARGRPESRPRSTHRHDRSARGLCVGRAHADVGLRTDRDRSNVMLIDIRGGTMQPSYGLKGKPKRVPTVPVLAIALVVAAAGCGRGAASVSSDQVRREAEVVWRAELRPGSTGATAARIVQSLIDVDGVWSTHGDDGQHVWVYSLADVSPRQMGKIRQRVERVPAVVAVARVR